MKTYKSILTFSLVLGSLGISGCNLHTQQEFEKICLSGGHSEASCDCIYQQLEKAYSPKMMQAPCSGVTKVVWAKRWLSSLSLCRNG